MEMFPDSELYIMFANGFTATFEFKENIDVWMIGRKLLAYVL